MLAFGGLATVVGCTLGQASPAYGVFAPYDAAIWPSPDAAQALDASGITVVDAADVVPPPDATSSLVADGGVIHAAPEASAQDATGDAGASDAPLEATADDGSTDERVRFELTGGDQTRRVEARPPAQESSWPPVSSRARPAAAT